MSVWQLVQAMTKRSGMAAAIAAARACASIRRWRSALNIWSCPPRLSARSPPPPPAPVPPVPVPPVPLLLLLDHRRRRGGARCCLPRRLLLARSLLVRQLGLQRFHPPLLVKVGHLYPRVPAQVELEVLDLDRGPRQKRTARGCGGGLRAGAVLGQQLRRAAHPNDGILRDVDDRLRAPIASVQRIRGG